MYGQKNATPIPPEKPNQSQGSQPPQEEDNLIVITSPKANERITSPVTLTGKARGNWFFEASFPIELFDNNGQLLGTAIAQAQDEWMTTEFVPFEAILSFSASTTDEGVLVFKKDNPSGLPEHDDELEIPVTFAEVLAK